MVVKNRSKVWHLMFIRFVWSNTVSGLAAREGFFCAAYELRESTTLDQNAAERLEALLAWFRHHLPVPDKFNKSTSKGAYRRDTKGLSWFKPTAKDVLSKSFELISLLEENGYSIEMLKSERVGYIVYEDESQIVAEPFSDTQNNCLPAKFRQFNHRNLNPKGPFARMEIDRVSV